MFISMNLKSWIFLFSHLNLIVKNEGHKIIYETIESLKNNKKVLNNIVEIFNLVGLTKREQILLLLENIKNAYYYDSIIKSINEVRDRCGVTDITLLSGIKKIKLENAQVFLARGLFPYIKDGYAELLSDEAFILEVDDKVILCIHNFYINPIILPSKEEMGRQNDLSLKRTID